MIYNFCVGKSQKHSTQKYTNKSAFSQYKEINVVLKSNTCEYTQSNYLSQLLLFNQKDFLKNLTLDLFPGVHGTFPTYRKVSSPRRAHHGEKQIYPSTPESELLPPLDWNNNSPVCAAAGCRRRKLLRTTAACLQRAPFPAPSCCIHRMCRVFSSPWCSIDSSDVRQARQAGKGKEGKGREGDVALGLTNDLDTVVWISFSSIRSI